MGIHEDVQEGRLLKDTLTRYIQDNPDIVNEQHPTTGRAPLATAAVAGFADQVELLLNNGAKADALSRDGETALLLTTSAQSVTSRPRIVQLLLSKTPAGSIDATTAAHDNNTPLMYAVLGRDVESIRLLVKAGASPKARNKRGLTAEKMATELSDKAVQRALNPKEQTILATVTAVVGSFLLYVVAWVNKTAKGVMRRLFGMKPKLDLELDEKINDGETPNKAQFLENVDDAVTKNPTLSRFFKGNPKYIQELAKKVTELDPDTPIAQPDLLPKTILVSLHQQVIYCDDSASMKRNGRWDAQVRLVKKITQITTQILPDVDGIALRFINQDKDNSETLKIQQIGSIIDNTSWLPNGDTPIGTNLRSKILEPLVYRKLQPPTLARPLLISVITDGMPSQENEDALVEAIKECGSKLEQAGYPRKSVTFMIGQIGTAKSAAAFLKGVGNNTEISDMVFVTTDQLDDRLSAFKENEAGLDRWLMETLFEPLKTKR